MEQKISVIGHWKDTADPKKEMVGYGVRARVEGSLQGLM